MRAKGRYRAVLGSVLPEELLIVIVALVDKVVHDDVSAVSASNLLLQVPAARIANAAKESFIGQHALKKAGL